MGELLTPSKLCLRALQIFDETWKTDPTFTEEGEYHPFRVDSWIKEQYSVGFYFPESALELPLENFSNRWLRTAVNRLIDKMPAISTLDCDPPGQRLGFHTSSTAWCAVENSHGVRMRLSLAEYPILSLDVPSSWGTWKPWHEHGHRHVGTVMRLDVRAVRRASPG